MECPACGAISDGLNCCGILGSEPKQDQESILETVSLTHELNMNSASEVPREPAVTKSTLIEFPGVNRSTVPEWRKELSERVREVQERRAREAARESTEIEAASAKESGSTPQLELLPPAEMPAMNPLVAAALKRIERAHQVATPDTHQTRNNLATAVAYAPAREENEPEALEPVALPQLDIAPELEPEQFVEEQSPPALERSHNLVVVSTVEAPLPEVKKTEMPTPKRLIVDDPNDPALNYLDSISRNICIDEIDSHRAGAFRRLVCGLLDLLICAALCVPIALAMKMTDVNLQDPRAIEVLAGSLVVVTFIYLTLNTALTGRTLAMRLLSLRIIDTKTGLIPTGSQSLGRSFLYIVSLALAGVGVLYALLSREGYALHDRFTGTAVIRT